MYFLKRAKKLKLAQMSLAEAVCSFFKETGGVQKRLAFLPTKVARTRRLQSKVQSPMKKVIAKRVSLFATQNEVKYAMFVPQGMGPNTPCLALIWRLFLVFSWCFVFGQHLEYQHSMLSST